LIIGIGKCCEGKVEVITDYELKNQEEEAKDEERKIDILKYSVRYKT
jgi:hypothetical protein